MGDRRVGGLSASMYLLTVPLWIPNSLAIPLMDSPLRFACCTAFHLYYDGSRGGFYSQQAGKGIFTGAMTRLYGWIALGVVTTGAVGWLSHQAGIQESILENFGMIGYFVVLGVWLAARPRIKLWSECRQDKASHALMSAVSEVLR